MYNQYTDSHNLSQVHQTAKRTSFEAITAVGPFLAAFDNMVLWLPKSVKVSFVLPTQVKQMKTERPEEVSSETDRGMWFCLGLSM